jgi:hypothetical protein
MLPVKGFLCISSKAARSKRRLLAGAFASCFSARFTMFTVQVMKKFLECSELASGDFGAAFADSYQFGSGRAVTAVMALKVLPPGFA